MNTMTIGKKISLACVVLVALTIIMGAVSIVNVGRISTAVNELAVDTLPGIASIGRLDGLMKEQRALVLRHMLMETPEQKSLAESAMVDMAGKFQSELRFYEKTMTMAGERELFGKIAPPVEQFTRAWAGILPLSRESKQKEAAAIWMSEGLPAANAAGKAIQDLVDLNKTSAEA